jgi:hypothetical protein
VKYLTDYTNDPITAAMEKAGAFFAFGDDQFNRKRKEGVKYLSMGMGLICPEENCDELARDIIRIGDEARAEDMKDHGKEAIIDRELANHECYYTGDPEPCIDALEGYPITREEIIERYRKNYAKQAC